ncbi:MAG: hypothetical protein HKN32_04240 [Flavobacteriales bacterium]|nr:hypothetical protein [Flavobacteriales bacterium]
MSVDELKREARQLPEKERADFVADLLSTFPAATYDVSDAEVAQRVAETESGEVEDISFAELKAAIQRRSPK